MKRMSQGVVETGIARMTMLTSVINIRESSDAARTDVAARAVESQRARRYPLSRWYLRPAAGWMARALSHTAVQPWQLTLCGLLVAMLAAAVLLFTPEHAAWASALVLLYWFFDRADGQLARWRNQATAWGAWLDANVDELVDLGLHAALACAASLQADSQWPWLAYGGFLFGKYLLMYGMFVDIAPAAASRQDDAGSQPHGWCQMLYHLPGNADVRIHLLAGALLTGWLHAELWLIAAYYNLRWIARYYLVLRRGSHAGGAS